MHAARVATIVCAVVMTVPVVSASPVYSRHRDLTEGLTNAELYDSFTTTYGTSMLIPTEAPTRDMVRRLSEELTRRQRDEQSRIDNKSAFTP